MSIIVDELSLYLGPKFVGAPDDLDKCIVDELNKATHSILIATQQLSNKDIVQSLINARNKGVQVKIIIEKDYLCEKSVLIDPWVSLGENEANRLVLSALYRARIDVRVERSSTALHNNFIIIDYNDKSAVTISTSANLNDRGIGLHLNHVLILHNSNIAKEFFKEFVSLWNNTAKTPHLDAPLETMVSGLNIKLVFAPEHSPEMEVMKQISKARKSIKFAIYSFSKTSGIDDALKLSAETGVNIIGFFDQNQGNQSWAASHDLSKAGISVFYSKKFSDKRKVHHKLMVIDSAVTIVGTFNYSKQAKFNEESIIIIGKNDKNLSGSYQSITQSKIAEYAEKEIHRMIEEN